MPWFLALFLSLFSLQLFAIENLEDPEQRAIILSEINQHAVASIEVSEGVYLGELADKDLISDIVNKVKNSSDELVEVTVRSMGFLYTYDMDFGDPVEEYSFLCFSQLKLANKKWQNTATTCDF